MTVLKLLVAADIHASQSETAWSHVTIEPPEAAFATQPLADLQEFVNTNNLRCDFLVVPGDIADQADSAGLQYAWLKLQELAAKLEATIIASPGNHDVVTHSRIADRSALLKNLRPTFPTGIGTQDAQFWHDGFTILEGSDYRFVILDSTHDFPPYPDGGDASPAWAAYLESLNRGSFTPDMEARLREALRTLTPKINFLVLHHHPQEHQMHEMFKDSYGPMARGDDLIALLSELPLGRWMIIHGHKHLPQLFHVGGDVGGEVVTLCAASLGAHLWKPVSTSARNLFHIATVSNDSRPGLGTLRGTVESFYWGYGEGWKPSYPHGCGMPAISGFGCISDPADLASQVIEHMTTNSLEYLDYESLVGAVPEIPFQPPRPFAKLEATLEANGYGFVRSARQHIVQLVKEN